MIRRTNLILLLSVVFYVLLIPASICAHDYAAPYYYMTGIYSPDGKPVSYPKASDAEIAWLLKQLADNDKEVRAIAAIALGQTQDKRVVEPLIKALKDRSARVQANAAASFVHIKDPRCIKPLIELMKNGMDVSNLMTTGYSLAAQGDDGISAVLSLSNSLKDSFGIEFIAGSILVVKGPESVDWAVNSLKSGDKKMLPLACEVLKGSCNGSAGDEGLQQAEKALKDPEVVQKLRAVAKDKTSNCREAAEYVLLYSDKGKSKPANKLTATDVKKLATQVKMAKSGNDGSHQQSSQAREDAQKLALSGDPTAINALISIMKGTKTGPAWIAAYALSQSNDPKAIDALMQVLKNRKSPIYSAAVVSIDNMRSAGMVPFLIKLLSSSDVEVVAKAIGGLGDIRDKRATSHLAAMLSNLRYTTECCRSLAQIGDPAAIDAVVSLLGKRKLSRPEDSQAFVAVMVCCGKDAVDRLLPLLENQSPTVRACAAQAFQMIKDPKSVEPLIKSLDDTSPNVRAEVVCALQFQRDDRAVKPLISMLKDSDASVRKSAVNAMTVYVDPSAAEPLALLLKDEDEDIRTLAGATLGLLGDERGRQEVVRALASESLSVPVVRAAGKLKEKQATKPILSTLGVDVSISAFDGTNEQDLMESRIAKIEALKSITGQDFGYAFYRWISWWVAQGNDAASLFENPAEEDDYLSDPDEDQEAGVLVPLTD